jgi:hypothetical protein
VPELPQDSLISTFTKTVSAIESTIDQIRQPGMKRTCVRSPDRFRIENTSHPLRVGPDRHQPGGTRFRAPTGLMLRAGALFEPCYMPSR